MALGKDELGRQSKQKVTYRIDGRPLDGAPPLVCASAAGASILSKSDQANYRAGEITGGLAQAAASPFMRSCVANSGYRAAHLLSTVTSGDVHDTAGRWLPGKPLQPPVLRLG